MKLILGINAQRTAIGSDELKKLKVGLGKKNLDHRFVPQESYHISLINFGDVKEEDYAERDVYIKNIIQETESFDLKLNGIWAYPNQLEARLLWVGVQNSRELNDLQFHLSMQIPSICELDYKPILPIVRMRSHHSVTDIISPYKGKDFGRLWVENISLYEMVTSGAYPTYRIIKNYYLAAAGSMLGLGM